MTQQDKDSISKIHDKFYGKGAKAKKENTKITIAIKGKKLQAGTIEEVAPAIEDFRKQVIAGKTKEGSRAQLMEQAKAQKIAYFRIMTKAELEEIINGKAPLTRICQIQEAAKARWKAGWKK